MNSITVTSLLLGLLTTTTSPCILPLYPGFPAYLGSQNEPGRRKYFLGLFVLMGVLTVFPARHSRVVHMIGGVLLIGVAIYDLTKNWELLQLFLGKS